MNGFFYKKHFLKKLKKTFSNEIPLLSEQAPVSISNIEVVINLITSEEKKKKNMDNRYDKLKKYREKMAYYDKEHPSSQYPHKNKLRDAFTDEAEWADVKKEYPFFNNNTHIKDWEKITHKIINPLLDKINNLESEVLPRLRGIKTKFENNIKTIEGVK